MLLKLYKYSVTILVVLLLCNCKEDKLHNHELNFYAAKNYVPDISCELLVQQIRDCNRYEGESIGIAGVPSEQYKRFIMLCDKASDQELLQLTNDTNAIVRCYAFEGLSQRNVMYMESVLRDHLNDTAKVETLSGCLGMPGQVNLIFISTASPYLTESAINKYRSVAKYKNADIFSVMH